jgi:soluble lytic murein transglycosylase
VRRLAVVGALVAAGALAYVALDATQPAWWQRLWYPYRYGAIVRGHAANYRLDGALLAAVIYEESRFRAGARSKSGAIGLMQLLPSTAEGIAARTGGTRFRVSDLYDPELNVRYGAWYLRHLLDKYGDERTALAAYNAGQRNVDRWRARGGAIAFAETRHYVDRVEQLKRIYRHAYGHRLDSTVPEHVAAAAERLAQALRASIGLRLLDRLGEAAPEVSAQLPSGHVEVQLAGEDPRADRWRSSSAYGAARSRSRPRRRPRRR